MYGSCAATHTEEKYASECLALPENVIAHFKKSADHAEVYVFDRGQSSAESFREMKSHKGLLFVGRLLENRKLHIVRDFDLTFRRFQWGELKQDAIVYLYKQETVEGKNGKPVKRQVLVKETFRIIRFRPEHGKEDIVLITDIFRLRAETIVGMYRRRWDIEVFFRFLKQEVNFSHFISLNENGIQVILYMTLIAAMLIMIYKKENETGFKTAKRRIKIELQEWITAIAVIASGEDLRKANLPAP
jgi:transposase